jgi:hypothetical protein
VRDGERVVGAVLHEPASTTPPLLLTLDSAGHAVVHEFVLPATTNAAPPVVHRSVLPVPQPTVVAGLAGPASNVRALVGTKAGDLCLFEWHTKPHAQRTASAAPANALPLVTGGVLLSLRHLFVGGVTHVAVDVANRFCLVGGEAAKATFAVALCWLGAGKAAANLLCVLPVDGPIVALAALTTANGTFKVWCCGGLVFVVCFFFGFLWSFLL